MIRRIVKMKFRPEEINNFLTVFRLVHTKIVAVDGCHSVDLLQDKTDPTVIFTYSLWDSEEALNAYRHYPFFKDTWSKTKALFADRPLAWSTISLTDQGVPDSKSAV
jgi:Uncharacterized conserved protein